MSSYDDRFPTQAIPRPTEEAPVTEEQPRPSAGSRGLAWELLQTIALTLIIFFAVRAVVQNFRVEGASMEPTLQTGEYLLIDKAPFFHVDGTPLDKILPVDRQGSVDYLFGGPQRGDVVVFKAPPSPSQDFIKRLIGLPGDMVLIKGGQVFVNGQALSEPYIKYPTNYTYPTNGQPVQVPDRDYLVLGDNRPNSSDSHLGWFVPVDNFVGRAWVDYWPPSDWQVFPHVSYQPAS